MTVLKALFWFAVFGIVVLQVADRYVAKRRSLKDDLSAEPTLQVRVLWTLMLVRGFLGLIALLLVVVAAKALWP